MLKVTKVSAKDNYTLFVELSDGRSGYFDVKPYLEKGVFKQLKDKNYFKQVKSLLSLFRINNELNLTMICILNCITQKVQ